MKAKGVFDSFARVLVKYWKLSGPGLVFVSLFGSESDRISFIVLASVGCGIIWFSGLETGCDHQAKTEKVKIDRLQSEVIKDKVKTKSLEKVTYSLLTSTVKYCEREERGLPNRGKFFRRDLEFSATELSTNRLANGGISEKLIRVVDSINCKLRECNGKPW